MSTDAQDGRGAQAMEGHSDPQGYNYAVFPPTSDRGHFAGFPEHLKVGAEAPDGVLTPLLADGSGGAPVRLGDLWRETNLVLEFGSAT